MRGGSSRDGCDGDNSWQMRLSCDRRRTSIVPLGLCRCPTPEANRSETPDICNGQMLPVVSWHVVLLTGPKRNIVVNWSPAQLAMSFWCFFSSEPLSVRCCSERTIPTSSIEGLLALCQGVEECVAVGHMACRMGLLCTPEDLRNMGSCSCPWRFVAEP